MNYNQSDSEIRNLRAWAATQTGTYDYQSPSMCPFAQWLRSEGNTEVAVFGSSFSKKLDDEGARSWTDLDADVAWVLHGGVQRGERRVWNFEALVQRLDVLLEKRAQDAV